MKHIFVVNPVSGKGKNAKDYIPTIEKYIREKNLDADIYVTSASRDGMRYVEEVAKKGEPVRFYSCGGDGTLYEIVNGCYKYPNCQVANIPLGSGNDFCRLFGKNTNLSDHVNGVPVKLDLIETNGAVAINECAMGLDSEICIRHIFINFINKNILNNHSIFPFYNKKKAHSAFKLYPHNFSVVSITINSFFLFP